MKKMNSMKSQILKNTLCIIFCLYVGFLKTSYGSLSYMPAILDEFKIRHPIITNTLIDSKDLVSIVKCMSFQGHQINFNQNGIDLPYQSHLIFTKLKNFTWNQPTYVPILVVSRIENESNLKKVDVLIGSEVLFLDWFSLKVYESYTVNKILVTRYLGQFQENKNGIKFVQSNDYIFSMEKRRDNFYGLNIKVGITDAQLGNWDNEKLNPEDFPDKVIFFPNNDTYDVTNLITSSEYKNEAILVLNEMETKFNFTAKLFLRKDMKYGSPNVLSNGSIELGVGAFRDMYEGSVDFLCASITMLPERAEYGTFLPPIAIAKDAIYIPIVELAESLDWDVFWGPFSTKMWIALAIKCIIFSICAYIIEWLHNYNIAICSIFYKIWASFTPNFGGTPYESKTDHIASYKTLVFFFMLDGLLLWTTYQSVMYTDLSRPLIKIPFNDLDSFANSDYILYTRPKDGYEIDVLSSPAYEKVMENNVKLDLSFNDLYISIEKTLKEPKSALFAKSYYGLPWHCQLKEAWTSSSIIGVSMLMNKRSHYTKIFSRAISDRKVFGGFDRMIREYSQQMDQSCDLLLPDQKEKSLGYKKLASLFALLASGTLMSLLVALFEFFSKMCQIQKNQKLTPTIHEGNPIDNNIKEIINDMPKDEIEKTFKRILQNLDQE